MGIWSTLFSSGDTMDKATDAVISTGDKLWYTEEERAEHKIQMQQFFPTLLKAYHPFKVAQRIIAIMVVGVFLLTHLSALGFYVAGYMQGVDSTIVLSEGLFDKNNEVLGWPVAIILSFYFAGGMIESVRRGSK